VLLMEIRAPIGSTQLFFSALSIYNKITFVWIQSSNVILFEPLIYFGFIQVKRANISLSKRGLIQEVYVAVTLISYLKLIFRE